MKEQLSDIENEKVKFLKISELTNSLGQSNLVQSPFKKSKAKKITETENKNVK